MVCVPHGFDHFDVATRVASAQVGIPLYSMMEALRQGKAFSSENVTNAIKTITETEKYSKQANKLSKIFLFAGGARRASDLVEFYAEVGYDHLRPGKLNSQFIVTTFSVLHAGVRSLFRFHIRYSVNKPQITGNKKPQIAGNHKTLQVADKTSIVPRWPLEI